MCRGHCAVLKMIKSGEHQNHYPYGIERLVLGSAEVKRCILFTDNRESIQAERRAESQFVVSDDQSLLLSEIFTPAVQHFATIEWRYSPTSRLCILIDPIA